MKLIDCFMYFDEDVVLDLRLNILKDIVDKFVIVESRIDHAGNTKKLNFDLNKFKNFKDIRRKIKGKPILKIETPNKGIANKAAGTKPIRVLKIAVKVKAAIISLILIGAIKRLVKFLLQISSRNIML